MNETINLVRFVSQKCKKYSPALDASYWVMDAEFSDGKVRRFSGWLKEGQSPDRNEFHEVVK